LPDHARIDLDGRSVARRNLWAAKLDDAVRRADGPVLLVAHGLSCLAIAWWARLSPAFYLAPVCGALFLAPARVAETAAEEGRLFDSPSTLLPFPSIVVDDGAASDDAVRMLALGWGSHWTDGLSLGAFGRREGQAAWLRGERLLRGLFAAAFDGSGNADSPSDARRPRPALVRQRRV
jgi:predicted alpha/beta hydrolase family esterase